MFVGRCDLVRQTLDNPAITTDIIVGFPGETEADFEATCRVSRDCGFSKIHIFPFSPRKGTPAAAMSDIVAPQVKAERCERLAEVECELRRDYFRSLIGRPLTVLVEGASESAPGSWFGTACRYAPVEITSDSAAPGELIDIQPLLLRNNLVLSASSLQRA